MLLFSQDQRFTCAQCGRCCHRTTVPITAGEAEAYRKAGAARWFREGADDTSVEPARSVRTDSGTRSAAAHSKAGRRRVRISVARGSLPHPREPGRGPQAARVPIVPVSLSFHRRRRRRDGELRVPDGDFERGRHAPVADPRTAGAARGMDPRDARTAGDYRAGPRARPHRRHARGAARSARRADRPSRAKRAARPARQPAADRGVSRRPVAVSRAPARTRRLRRVLRADEPACAHGRETALDASALRVSPACCFAASCSQPCPCNSTSTRPSAGVGSRSASRLPACSPTCTVSAQAPPATTLAARHHVRLVFEDEAVHAIAHRYLRASLDTLGTGRRPIVEEVSMTVAHLNAACVLARMHAAAGGKAGSGCERALRRACWSRPTSATLTTAVR